MAEPQRHETSRAALKRRRRELGQCLGELGLRSRPRRFPRPVADAEENLGRRWREAFARLGPVPAALGVHLASRMDLLPDGVRRELARLEDRGEPTPPERVRRRLARALGNPEEVTFRCFEAVPHECRLFSQCHHAALANGEPVTVKLVHPEIEESLAVEMELLPELASALSRLPASHGARRALDAALIELTRSLPGAIELTDEAEALESLGGRVAWATPRVLVRAREAGTTLDELLTDAGAPGGRELAHGLWVAWLRQVLTGGRFAAEPRPADVLATPDGQITFTGGTFERPTPSFQDHLRRYLQATADQEVDQAYSAFLRETAEAPADRGDELRRRFRQALPFRDGPRTVRGDFLADYLLLHWRLATARGIRPRPLLLAFYRGLYLVHDLARRLAPEHDGLPAALEELRLDHDVAGLRRAMDPARLGEDFRQYAALAADLPRRMDTALSLIARGSVRLRLRLTEDPAHRRTRGAPYVALALLPVIVALVLATRHLATIPVLGPWNEKLGAIALLLAGGWLLGCLGKSR